LSGSDVEDFDIGEFDTEDIYNEDKLMKEAILRSSSEIKIRFCCVFVASQISCHIPSSFHFVVKVFYSPFDLLFDCEVMSKKN
jgi:hypothetical protein